MKEVTQIGKNFENVLTYDKKKIAWHAWPARWNGWRYHAVILGTLLCDGREDTRRYTPAYTEWVHHC